jgi:hypothetical protein
MKAENLVAVDARPEEARGYICLCLLSFFSTCRVAGGEVITTKEAVRDLQNNCSCCLVVVPAPLSHVLNS